MKKVVWVISILLVLTMAVGCRAANPTTDVKAPEVKVTEVKVTEKGIVGTWKSDQDGTVVEYTADGKYKGLNDLDYTYEIIDDKEIKISNPEYTDGSDAILLTFTLDGDVLKTVYNDYEVTWKRVTK